MSDSINRSAAIHAVCAFAILRYHASPEDLDAIGAVLNALPSAQPERIRGRWGTTVASPTLIVCNRCGRTVLKNGSVHWNFCPNCGAKMEVSE